MATTPEENNASLSQQDIETVVLQFIREQPIAASISPLDLNTPVEELKLDSLDMVEMMMEMETRLNLKIKDPEEKFKTIHDIVNHIVRSSNKSE